MQKLLFLLLIQFSFFAVTAAAQDTLPNITVKNLSGQIIVSWVNNYKAPVSTINIQRSYDSLKNYTTIGSVLNPQNIENGYADATPPYNKMYYRVFISFEGGTYLFSNIVKPIKEKLPASLMQLVDSLHPFLERENWAVKSTINNALKPKSLALEKLSGVITEADESRRPLLSKGNWAAQGTITNNVKTTVIGIQPKPQLPVINTNTEIITYPSRRIYTGKDNNIVVYLPNAETKKYTIKFFDENENLVFELNKITEPYLTI
ncbi:MAG: hypothetical protein WCG67_05830, partial [Ferruginibacter sp.]